MKRSLSREDTVKAVSIIQDKSKPKVERDLWARKLAVDYKGVVLKHAKYYYGRRKDVTDKDDLISAGWKGFYDSLLKYDVAMADEVQFITYVTGGIQMAVLGAYRNQVSVRGVEASTFTELSAGGEDEDPDEDSIMRVRMSKTGMQLDTAIEETDAGHTVAQDLPAFVERFRREGTLSLQESILLFVKEGMGTDTGNHLRVAKELGIKQAQVRLEMADIQMDTFIFKHNSKKACHNHR